MAVKANRNSYVKEAKKRNNKKRSKKKIFANRPKGQFVSFLSQFAGSILAIVAGALFGLLCIQSVFQGVGLGMDAFLFLFLCAVGCVCYYRGRKVRKLFNRFRFYRRYLEGRDIITLDELSDLTGRDVEFLRKDIKDMFARKLFLQGHMDEQETCLMLTDAAYEEYLNMTEVMTESNTDEISEAEEKNEVPVKGYREIATEYLAYFEETQRQLKSRTVQKMVTDYGVYTVRILGHEIENEDRERFLMYYLPVTKKLLLAYNEMEKEGMAEKAGDLEDMLNTVRYSFETFAEKLAEGKGMDVETDILALDSMLSRI